MISWKRARAAAMSSGFMESSWGGLRQGGLRRTARGRTAELAGIAAFGPRRSSANSWRCSFMYSLAVFWKSSSHPW